MNLVWRDWGGIGFEGERSLVMTSNAAIYLREALEEFRELLISADPELADVVRRLPENEDVARQSLITATGAAPDELVEWFTWSFYNPSIEWSWSTFVGYSATPLEQDMTSRPRSPQILKALGPVNLPILEREHHAIYASAQLDSEFVHVIPVVDFEPRAPVATSLAEYIHNWIAMYTKVVVWDVTRKNWVDRPGATREDSLTIVPKLAIY